MAEKGCRRMPLISINDLLQNLSHYHRKYTLFENFALASTFCHIPFPNMNSNKLSPSFTDFNTFYIVIALKSLTNCLNFESTNGGLLILLLLPRFPTSSSQIWSLFCLLTFRVFLRLDWVHII
uniref:(northern house mosquito) hypothetical protein n=1 Tax=Culex pipiens TaxID=7175 RepID=A0A8D8F582_CULPI